MISGVFDLSVGSIMGLAGVVTSIFLANKTPAPISILCGLAVGAAFGLVNGLLVGYLKLNHLIVTIGTMTIGRGFTILLLRGENRFGVGGFSDAINSLGNSAFLHLYMMTWIAVILALAVQFVLMRVGAGRKLYYVGGNREVAQLFGVNVRKVRLTTFLFCDVLAALAGILVVLRIGASARYLGDGLEMRIIISCLIGGVSLAGGRGSIVATALGVVFMTLVANSFSIFEIGAYWQDIVIGLILIVVVSLDAYISMLRTR
jgi:ribose/xylose/arabinose/galactoside ABC-type transport system permease subunit